jgi:trk system potassium uptake protein TrkH
LKYVAFKDLKKKKVLSAETVLLFGFLLIIFVGSLLLFLPFSNTFHSLHPKYYFDCLFTAVSCVCVTGLSTVTPAVDFTPFGQGVMLLLIQVGGLGFMTIAVLLSRIIRRKITPKEQLIAAQAYGLASNENVRGLITRIVLRTLLIEGVGALLLLSRMWVYAESFGKAIWMSVFHSVSAFCNAGFDLFSFEEGSLTGIYNDYLILSVLMVLIVVGGIGFVIWDDLYDNLRKKRRKLSVYSRFILIATLVLILSGTVLTLIFEWDNPLTLGKMSYFEKGFNALFHSVSLRTAGFASFGNAAMRETTKLVSCIFMFIGGASGSTAGGVKVGTVGIILFSVFASAVGKKTLVIGKRTINWQVVQRATALFFIGVFIIFAFTGVIALLENKDTVDLLYEVTSAFATVGLSANLTASLSIPTKLLIMVLMYFGRVGVLTITASLAGRTAGAENGIKYPDTNFYIG